MRHELKLTQSGMGMTEGSIATWHKAPGDSVRKGEILVEVETAKAMMEIASPVDGVLEKIVVAQGETAEVDATIAWLLEKGKS